MTNRFFAGQTNFIEELNLLDGESGTAQAAIDAHIADTTAAHAASAISNTPAGNIAATTVQGAINELDTEKLSASATALPSSFASASLNSIAPTGGTLGVTGAISTTGNIGLGVSPYAWGGGYKSLDVLTYGSLALAGGTFQMLNNAYFNGTDYIYKNTAAATDYVHTAGTHGWRIAPSGTAGSALTFSTAMSLDSAGLTVTGSISATSLVDISAAGAGQIKFPATQNASADANTLDDYQEATYTGTATGMTASPTGTVSYTLTGNEATLNLPEITGTSNATTFTVTGMPAEARPASRKTVLGRAQDNGGAIVPVRIDIETTGVLTIYANADAGAFTSSGTKTLAECSVTYTRV